MARFPKLPVTASVEQKKAEVALIKKVKFQRLKKLEKRLSKGTTKFREEDQLQIEQFESSRREKLVLRLQGGQLKEKNQIFLSVMCHWYQFMEPRKKKKVTVRHLKKQAWAVCCEFNMSYHHLPRTWIETMKKVVGIKFAEDTDLDESKDEGPSSPSSQGEIPKSIPTSPPATSA